MHEIRHCLGKEDIVPSPFDIRKNSQILLYPPRHGHFHILDGLRAIAVLWVVAFHCVLMTNTVNLDLMFSLRARPVLAWTRWGLYGVDIFFVVSGFIIGYLLMKEVKDTGTLDIPRFYLRRALRLLPAYYVTMLVCSIVIPLNLKNIWANLLYVNNLLPFEHQFMHWAWSLAIEEQFYILFPWLLLLFARSRLRWTLFLAGMLAAVIIRASIMAYQPVQFPLHWRLDASYFEYFDLLYGRLHERYGALLMGAGVAYYYLNGGLSGGLWRHKGLRTGLALVVLLTLLPALLTPEVTDPAVIEQPYYYLFVVHYPYVFAAGIAILLLLCLGEHSQHSILRRALSARFWFPFSQLSYSAYLVHPIVILLFLRKVDRSITHVDNPTALLAGAGLIAAVFVTAAIVYFAVERPFMNVRRGREAWKTPRA